MPQSDYSVRFPSFRYPDIYSDPHRGIDDLRLPALSSHERALLPGDLQEYLSYVQPGVQDLQSVLHLLLHEYKSPK